jgi:hypothetical protein
MEMKCHIQVPIALPHVYSSRYPLKITGETQSQSALCGKQHMPFPDRESNHDPLAYLQANLPLYELLLPHTDCRAGRPFSAVVGSPIFSDAQNVTATEQSAQKQQHRSLTAKFALLGVKYLPTTES